MLPHFFATTSEETRNTVGHEPPVADHRPASPGLAPEGIVAQVHEMEHEAEHALLANVVRGPRTPPEAN